MYCGSDTGYNVVQFLEALDLDSNQWPLDHGEMSVVIRYRNPYLIKKWDLHLFLLL